MKTEKNEQENNDDLLAITKMVRIITRHNKAEKLKDVASIVYKILESYNKYLYKDGTLSIVKQKTSKENILFEYGDELGELIITSLENLNYEFITDEVYRFQMQLEKGAITNSNTTEVGYGVLLMCGIIITLTIGIIQLINWIL